VDPPAAGYRVDDREPAPADAGEVLLTDGPLEPSAFVDHLDQEAILVERRSQRDLTIPMDDGVGDQLADQQPRRIELISAQPRRQPVRD
jgi:hypothetical protein